ncbi:hypothetical protein [Urbifossiella limnaea]|uniref:Uncharacterized protein n=1 Tax=Urbifossiella limnaea TaxID=2528023 RepID=A0A517XV41_9BACT|nr:hypothetical protein [Urbifossiella limnaea]QDU21375.1 hypothetical protein ETAA1_33420 [Urbifossiella limnaea]
MSTLPEIIHRSLNPAAADDELLDPLVASRPLRPLDWRWRFAGTLLRYGRTPHAESDDPWVHRAFGLRRHLADPTADHPRPSTPLLAAHDLLRSPHPFGRWVVEARLAAGQGVAAVASACGLSAATVTAYDRVFFDVCGRRKNRSVVHNTVIVPLLIRQGGVDDAERALKVIGYRRGPGAIDLLVQYFTTSPPDVPPDVVGVGLDVLQDWEWRLTVRLAVATEAVPADRLKTLGPLTGLLSRVRKRLAALRAADTGDPTSDRAAPGADGAVTGAGAAQ